MFCFQCMWQFLLTDVQQSTAEASTTSLHGGGGLESSQKIHCVHCFSAAVPRLELWNQLKVLNVENVPGIMRARHHFQTASCGSQTEDTAKPIPGALGSTQHENYTLRFNNPAPFSHEHTQMHPACTRSNIVQHGSSRANICWKTLLDNSTEPFNSYMTKLHLSGSKNHCKHWPLPQICSKSLFLWHPWMYPVIN